jgi:hypothetical protein
VRGVKIVLNGNKFEIWGFVRHICKKALKIINILNAGRCKEIISTSNGT